MNMVKHLQKAILMAALITMVTFNLVHAAAVLVSVTDPVGDNTGPVDVIGMDFGFNNETGNYTILLTATDAEPFLGDFRININLFNLDVGTTADDPSYFQDTINDFSLLVPSSRLILSGTNARLLSWDTGDRILLNNLPDGTPHPDGDTLFSSVVAARPSQSLETDVIGLDKEIAIATSALSTFLDVPPSHWAYDFIEIVAANGITDGCGPSIYCPDDQVTRAQVAVFLERSINGGDFIPDPGLGNIFLDVPASYWAAGWIELLYVDGITSGCGTNIYCPEDAVTREQVAVLLLRAKYGAEYQPPAPVGVFNDVAPSSFFAPWIEQLAAEGITTGCGDDNYCPKDAVTRDQMAVFLVKTFELE